ncbi:glycosyltransferase [Aurantimicrobium minutum]|uniref:glycosyltransferase n=1 Tax=Aurantimicrobium minutum TaxID=708131 RepID=UPI00247496B0|nr:glycosyltransferase [Aurantimicrobium minutum]MDH6255409.1 spore maturation protein CgeB [Aurantimicrobium minutum]
MTSIFIVDSYYQDVINSLGFGENEQLSGSYSIEVEKLANFGFGTGGAYRRELEILGWDAKISIPNSFALQSRWLKEKNYASPFPKGWSYGLYAARLPMVREVIHLLPHIQGTLYKQIVDLKPDVVFVQDLNIVTPALAKAIKKHTKLLVGEIASPLPPKPYFMHYDLIVSALPTIVHQVRKWGGESEYLPLGFDARWASFGESKASSRSIDAIFVGSFSRHQPQTIPLLQQVAQVVPGLQIFGNAEPDLLEANGLSTFFRGPAWGEQMFRLLGDSKIVVNRHGTIAGEYAVNMRMFEATGCGAALVTESKSNLSELFDPQSEVLTYGTKEEAAAQVLRALSNSKLLDEVSTRGQQKTLASHSYAQRAFQLSEIVSSKI